MQDENMHRKEKTNIILYIFCTASILYLILCSPQQSQFYIPISVLPNSLKSISLSMFSPILFYISFCVLPNSLNSISYSEFSLTASILYSHQCFPQKSQFYILLCVLPNSLNSISHSEFSLTASILYSHQCSPQNSLNSISTTVFFPKES